MSIISNFPISSGAGGGLAIYGPLSVSGYDMYERFILTPVIPKIAIVYGTKEIVVTIMNDFNDNNSGYTCYTHQKGTSDSVQLGCSYTDVTMAEGPGLYIDYLGTRVTRVSDSSDVAYVVG